jgi:uncharacterized protein YlxP (DUF503 family)
MIIGLVSASISIPEARSLKDKRSVVKGLKDRIRNRMNVSVAEVGRQDEWRFAELAFVTVSAESSVVQSRISQISEFLHGDPRYVLMNLSTELL